MERLWYIFSKGDVTLIRQLMDQFENSGAVTVPENILVKVGRFLFTEHRPKYTHLKTKMRHFIVNINIVFNLINVFI